MSQSELNELERLFQDVTVETQDGDLEERRRTNLDENLFHNLALFLSTLPAASSSGSSSGHGSDPTASNLNDLETDSQTLIDLFGTYASPRELLVVVGETLERAKGDVGDCFLDDEDDEDDNGLRGEGEVRKSDWAVQGVEIGDHREEEEDVGKSEEKLERVVRRVTAVLDILSVALSRYNPRQPPMTQLYPLLSALDSFTNELYRASPTISIIRVYLEGLGRFFTSVRTWLGDHQEGVQVEEGSRRMKEGLARVIVLGHKGLGIKALERWFVMSEEGGRMVESRRREEAEKGWQASEKEWTGLIEAAEATLRSLGSDNDSLISNMTINPSGFLPYASLILLTCPGRTSRTRVLIDKVEDKEELLRATMPVLGSAAQGLAGEAAWVWVGMVLEGLEGVDEMIVDILLEWLMPVMANDASDLNRFALHRLAYRLIRSVGEETAVVELFDKLVSPSNPFEEIRLSGMALLREHIRTIVSDAASRTDLEVFLRQLRSTVFPYLLTVPSEAKNGLKKIMGSIHLAWLVEVLALTVSLKGLVSKVQGEAESIGEEIERFLRDVEEVSEAIEREFSDLSSISGLEQGEKMDVEMALLSLEDGLRRAKEVWAASAGS